MYKMFFPVAAAFLLLSPALSAEMPLDGQGSGTAGFRSEGRQFNASTPQKQQAVPVPLAVSPAVMDNVSDILTFESKLGLTGQQVVSLRLIGADARQETNKRENEVQDCRQTLAKSLNENNPDFADIRARMNKLNEAQARVTAVPVEAYEKAYALLTDAQKSKLAFFKGLRQQENEKKAAEVAREREAAQTSPSSIPSSFDTIPPAFGR